MLRCFFSTRHGRLGVGSAFFVQVRARKARSKFAFINSV